MKKITLLTLFSVFATLIYGQSPAPPTVDADQYFCSATAWLLIGESEDNLGDLQVFPDVIGWTITWYEDNGGVPGPVIPDPDNEVLVAGTVYHVTQTDASNNESNPLAITVNERDCACIKDPTFEDQNGNPRARGYEFFEFDGISNHKTCGQSMAGAPTIPLGTVDGFFGPTNVVVLVTPGNDPPYVNTAGNPIGTLPLERTNPDNPKSSHGLRINRGHEYETNIAAGQKEFIAGEVISFAFSLTVQNPGTSHSFEQMPFGQVRLYDNNNSLLLQRCLVSDTNDCIFKSQGSGSQTVLFSDWTCMKLNTSEWQGEPLKIEFVSAFCTLTQHFSYIYIDDIYVGEDYQGLCDGPAFGYALIDKVETIGQTCFITQPPTLSGGCVPLLSGTVPGFPLEICGVFEAPISQGQNPASLNDITLNIIQNEVVVGTLANATAGSGANTFCFTVNDSDINVLPYGDFTFTVELDFQLDCGVPYNYPVDDRNTFTLCPAANCAAPLVVCDSDGTGVATFDLTEADPAIRGTWDTSELDITFFEDEQDAHDDTNPIANPANYTNTTPNYQVVYARLDWNIPGLTLDCYYIAEVDLMIQEIPDLVWGQDILVCGSVQSTLIATPSNLSDLGTVTYRWFKDGDQLPHAGSSLDVNESGEYTVIVSNMGCEISRTITVDKVDFEVDLGPDVSLCDSAGTYSLSPTVTPAPGTTFDINDVDYLWSTGETTSSITVTTAGLYWVEVTYEGCTEIDQVMMDIAIEPIITLGADIVKCKDETVMLEAVVTNMDASQLDYTWYDSGNNQVGTGSTLQVTEVFGGEEDFTVRAYDPLTPDCYGEDTINVKYFSNENCTITQGLSPDGSPGFNDNLDLAFLAQRTGIENLQIFNRFGVLVYEYSNYTNQWEGQSKTGDLLPTGLYYYVINLSGNDPVFGNQTNGYIYINRAAN